MGEKETVLPIAPSGNPRQGRCQVEAAYDFSLPKEGQEDNAHDISLRIDTHVNILQLVSNDDDNQQPSRQ